MNYLAHGWRFASQPYVLAGTAAPDWLSVIDRKVRLRSRTAAEFTADPDPVLAAVARGVVQHHIDDAWFHATPAFNELSFDVCGRSSQPPCRAMRASCPSFLLATFWSSCCSTAALTEDDPRRLDGYYAALASPRSRGH